MGRFQATHTKAQRLACVQARATRGWTYDEISEKAKRGELDGAGKFSVQPNTVGKWCRADLAEYQPERLNEPEHSARAIETARSRILAGILAEQDAWEKNRQAGQTNLAQAGRILRALHDWERTRPGAAKRETGQDEPHETTSENTADEIVRQLRELASARSNGETTAASLSPGDATRGESVASGPG